LTHGELVYTGALRTDLPAIVRAVNIEGSKVRVSSERFAFTADVHLVLSNITESQYTCDTADGRGKTIDESRARIARLVCGDIESVTEDQMSSIAASGLGANFLGRPTVEKANLGHQHSVQEVLGIDESVPETAFACALFAGLKKSEVQ
jgi:uncharacterized hydantoinase/oxoprolinase family protein